MRQKIGFAAVALCLLPLLADAQITTLVQPRLKDDLCTDNEVVVALQSGGVGTLRALNYAGGTVSTRNIADIPVRIESLDIGKIYTGKNSIVTGLSRQYPGTTGSVRVFTYNPAINNWNQESLGPTIVNNVEAIAVGDANNDGTSDIVAGLEGYYSNESRLRMYSRNATGWTEELITPPSLEADVESISIGDLYGSGTKSIIASLANTGVNQTPGMEIRAYTKSGSGWSSELIAGNFGTNKRAERILVANLDSDPELEIVVGAWSGTSYAVGSLYLLDHTPSGWQTTEIGPGVGAIDGLGKGSLTGGMFPDLIVGARNNVLLYRKVGAAWTQQLLSNHPNAQFVWDADTGDYDNDGVLDGIAAADRDLVGLKRLANGGFQATVLTSLLSKIDSAQIADVDGVKHACPLLELTGKRQLALDSTSPALIDFP